MKNMLRLACFMAYAAVRQGNLFYVSDGDIATENSKEAPI